jgi:uncharacterized membrane protein
MELIHWIILGSIVWLTGIFFAWGLVHGAEKLRRQNEAAYVTFERPAGGYITVAASAAA